MIVRANKQANKLKHKHKQTSKQTTRQSIKETSNKTNQHLTSQINYTNYINYINSGARRRAQVVAMPPKRGDVWGRTLRRLQGVKIASAASFIMIWTPAGI